MYRKSLAGALGLYTVALITTLAGMEIFSWMIFLLVGCGLIYQKLQSSGQTRLKLYPVGPDWVVWLLLVVVVLGVVINGAQGINGTESVGSMRWILLMYALLAALLYFDEIPHKYLHFFFVIASVVALNSVVMYLTGYNIVRGEPVSYSTEGVFRGSGFFSIPTTYAHSAAMICCLSVAALLTGYRPFKSSKALFLISTILLGISIITSYTRASYISLTAAICVMTLLLSRRLFLKVFFGLLIIGGVLFTTNSGFQARFISIFDMNYDSNSQRIDLWKAHFEMFKDYPILGVGLHDNERRNPEYNIKLGKEGAFSGNAHNNYLQFLAGTGFLGFSLYMLFIIYFLKLNLRLWQRREAYGPLAKAMILGIMGAQVSFHVAGLMDNNFKDAEVNHLFIFLLVLIAAIDLGMMKSDSKISKISQSAS